MLCYLRARLVALAMGLGFIVIVVMRVFNFT
jgi:hypothetical protein